MSIKDNCSSTYGTILVIENEEGTRGILKLQLESANYQVIEVTNGKEGIELMKKGSNLLQVGLIITDIRMPEVNGVEAIEYIKANALSIPIMVVTGYPDAELAVDLLRNGVEDYLVKPVNKDKLLNKVRAIFASKLDFEYV